MEKKNRDRNLNIVKDHAACSSMSSSATAATPSMERRIARITRK